MSTPMYRLATLHRLHSTPLQQQPACGALITREGRMADERGEQEPDLEEDGERLEMDSREQGECVRFVCVIVCVCVCVFAC
jgi:hypothetical protein